MLLSPAKLPVNAQLPSASRSVCELTAPNLPASIHVEDRLQPIVSWTLIHSPTFRQQCRVLAATPALTAVITAVRRPAGKHDRARAVVRHYDFRGGDRGDRAPELAGSRRTPGPRNRACDRASGRCRPSRAGKDRESASGPGRRIRNAAGDLGRPTGCGRGTRQRPRHDQDRAEGDLEGTPATTGR